MENTAKARPAKRGYSLVALLILALGITLSSVAAYVAHTVLMRDAETAFLLEAKELGRRIATEVQAYNEVLIGLAAFIGSRQEVSRAEFRQYVNTLDVPARFPGFQNLNYAEYAEGPGLERLVESVRSDTSADPTIARDFRVQPAGIRESYQVIVLAEPIAENRRFIGRDIDANPLVAEVARRVRDTGEISSSGRPIRVQGPNGYVALAMRLAVYRAGAPAGSDEDRRKAFRGSVGAGYRIADLARSVTSDAKRFGHLRFQIVDGGAAGSVAAAGAADEHPLFDNQPGQPVSAGNADARAPDLSERFRTTVSFPVGGRTWHVRVSAPKQLEGWFNRSFAWIVMAGGMCVTALLFALVNSLSHSRQRAEELALAITHDLRESEGHLAEAQRMASLGHWWLDVEQGRMHWSDEALRLLGTSRADAPADFDALLAVIHHDDREKLRKRLAGARLDATDYNMELRLHGADGALRWVHALGQAALDGEGRIAKLRGTFMDITARRIQEQRTELEVVLSRLLASPRAANETLQDVLRTTAGMYGWSAAVLWERGEPRGALKVAASAGDLPAEGCAAMEDMLSGAAAGVASWGRSLFVEKLPLWLGKGGDAGVALPQSVGAEIECALLLPVLTGGEVSDVLAFFAYGNDNCGDEATFHAMQVVASQLAHFLQRRRAEDSLKYVAMHDPLTGLPNRRHFHQALAAGIARAERGSHGMGVLFVDLDRFKNINDALGHSAGDAVLKICAQRFAEALRESDLIAHISGDEFVVLLERCSDPKAAIAVARKLLDAAARPILLNGQEIALTASVGVALHPADGSDGETLLKNADIALFRAKEQGRNNYQFYSAQMNTHTAERLALESKLRHALDRGELSLHYQPKLDIRTQQVTGAEALLRWTHPELGSVSPAAFIPLAEETGLIVPIGAWVLREAARQAKRWQESGIPGVRVAVNLSARQFRDPLLGQHISRALAESGLDPRLLELEITESMVMQEPEKAAALLADLKGMGLYLSIDDFGTGYSSLAYLKRFPIDTLKIDRSFIKDIPANADDLAITQAVVAMAHGLRLRTVAEGVETEEQLDWLKRFGCEEIQGYLFSKPLPAEEAGRFLSASFRKEGPGRTGRGRPVAVA